MSKGMDNEDYFKTARHMPRRVDMSLKSINQSNKHLYVLPFFTWDTVEQTHTQTNKHAKITHIQWYIYSHPQTDCFVLSELFSVARQTGRSKPGSKPVQLYVRLSLRSHGHQADHVG